MTRDELLLILNTLRTNEPEEQDAVPEWTQAIVVVVREIARSVEADHADR